MSAKKDQSHDNESVSNSHISEETQQVSYKYLVRIFKFYSAQTENKD